MTGTATVPAPVVGGRVALKSWYRALYGMSFRRMIRVAVVVPAVCIAVAVAAGPATAQVVLLGLLLGTATATDLLWRRIFNWPTVAVFGWLAALQAIAQVAPGSWIGLPTPTASVDGAFICFVVMFGMYVVFRGGEGDLKLLAAIGALVGPAHGLEVLVLGYLLAGVVALVIMAGRKAGSEARVFQARVLPMAPFFTAAVVLSLCYSAY